MMTPTDYLKMAYSRVVVAEPDGTFRSEIAEFPGCIATGETAVEALLRLEEVAESWLQSMIARNQAVPPPAEDCEFSGKLGLRLSRSLHRKAAQSAQRDGVSLNTFIATCVAEQVGMKSAAHQAGCRTLSYSQAVIIYPNAPQYLRTSAINHVTTSRESYTSSKTLSAVSNPWNNHDA